MINAGENFAAAVAGSSRRFRFRLFDNNNIQVSANVRSATVHLGSCGPDEFSVGAVFSSYAEIILDGQNLSIEGEELRISIGVLTDAVNDTYADMDLGYFTALTPKATKYQTIFTAVGGITSRLAPVDFVAPLSQTLESVAGAIQTLTGVTVSFESGIDTTGVIEHPITGTCRDALAVLAHVVGGYATETNTGSILISRYSSSVTAAYSTSRMTSLPEMADYDFEITGVQAVTTTGVYEDGDPINVTVDSNFITEDLFDAWADALIGLQYRPGTVPIALGDPRIEPSDVLRITTADNEEFIVPCMSIVHIYDGGLQTEISTPSVMVIGEVTGTMSKAVKEAVETAKEAAEQADDARKVAVNYLSRDSMGIMVADLNDGNQTPRTATGKNVLIDNDSVDIRAGQTVLASFGGSSVQIGNSADKNVIVDTDGLKIRDSTTELARFGEMSSQIGPDSEGHIIIGSDSVLGSYLRMLNGNDLVFEVNDTYLETSNGRAGVRMDYGPDVDPLIGIYYNQTIKVDLRYNKTSNKGEIWADYAQFTDAYIDHALTVYTAGGFIDLMGDSNSNRGLYDEPSASWIIRRNDLGVILGKLAGSISVDKTDITSASTAEVTVIGSQGENQISLFANNHNGHNAGLFDHGNSQWVLEYNNQSGWVKILGAQIKAGASQNVANNLSTTAAGSVLDARQGKALSDMLTAEAYDFDASSYSKLVNNAVVSRVGKLGILFLSSLTGLSANADTDLGITIPAKYRPTRGIVQDCIVAGATPACLRVTISTAGKVTVHNYTTSTGTMNIRARIPYICAGT